MRVVDHDPDWPGRASDAADALRTAAPGRFVALEHIGSTAVAGLAAKPVIDHGGGGRTGLRRRRPPSGRSPRSASAPTTTE
ncbi:MAG: hypothetical protein HOY76_50320 [Streptomyces sp.]|nr:hypothetical protein [Streptomyces sp.]